MPLYPAYSAAPAGAYTFDQSAVPTPTAVGNTWRERDSLGNVIQLWWWNGTYWVSIQLFQLCILMNGGNSISATTGGYPFSPGTTYDFFLQKIITLFYTTGVLSATNFWRLRFTLNALTATMFVDSTANANNFVESEVTFNQKFSNPKTTGGYYNCSFEIHGAAPSIGSATVVLEYRLVHP